MYDSRRQVYTDKYCYYTSKYKLTHILHICYFFTSIHRYYRFFFVKSLLSLLLFFLIKYIVIVAREELRQCVRSSRSRRCPSLVSRGRNGNGESEVIKDEPPELPS